ncbi:hypothetical protein H6P81_010407 [Aristolochia fimbriata]|uniref:Uncharacterized protein n=1 Tax=Aristolochia fimbriata TaxID=158543 RepID=A0AAV7ENP7_ARIFI|nr:hypothetical protein H6P81_010407 [Aristolochia fimbriata]
MGISNLNVVSHTRTPVPARLLQQAGQPEIDASFSAKGGGGRTVDQTVALRGNATAELNRLIKFRTTTVGGSPLNHCGLYFNPPKIGY